MDPLVSVLLVVGGIFSLIWVKAESSRWQMEQRGRGLLKYPSNNSPKGRESEIISNPINVLLFSVDFTSFLLQDLQRMDVLMSRLKRAVKSCKERRFNSLGMISLMY